MLDTLPLNPLAHGTRRPAIELRNQSFTYGSVRGAARKGGPYRDLEISIIPAALPWEPRRECVHHRQNSLPAICHFTMHGADGPRARAIVFANPAAVCVGFAGRRTPRPRPSPLRHDGRAPARRPARCRNAGAPGHRPVDLLQSHRPRRQVQVLVLDTPATALFDAGLRPLRKPRASERAPSSTSLAFNRPWNRSPATAVLVARVKRVAGQQTLPCEKINAKPFLSHIKI